MLEQPGRIGIDNPQILRRSIGADAKLHNDTAFPT